MKSTPVKVDGSAEELIGQSLRGARLLTMSYLAAVLLWGVILGIVVPTAQDGVPAHVGIHPTVESRVFIVAVVYSLVAVLVTLVILPRRNTLERLAERSDVLSIEGLAQALVGAHAVRGAVVESIGLFGFILAFVTRNMTYFLAFGGIAVVLLVFLFPRSSTWAEVQFFVERKHR